MKTCVAMICLTVLVLAWMARDSSLSIHITHTLDVTPLLKRTD